MIRRIITRTARTGILGLVIAVPVVATTGTAQAQAAATPTGGSRALAVSVPSEPVSIAAGTRKRITISVANPNLAPITITLSGRSVRLLNNGAVRLGANPAANWQGKVAFPTAEITIGSLTNRTITLAVHVPRHVSPDLYFIGFLVTPLPSRPGNVQVINQIGSFLTVNVPGPRLLKLAASLQTGSFKIGSSAAATIHVRNTGHSVAQFWGETDTTSWPDGARVHQDRFDTLLLPIGTSRSFTVSAKPAWPIGFVTMRVLLVYHGPTNATTREIILSKRVLVISPAAFGGLIALLVGAILAIVLLLRRLGPTRRRQHNRLLRPRPLAA